MSWNLLQRHLRRAELQMCVERKALALLGRNGMPMPSSSSLDLLTTNLLLACLLCFAGPCYRLPWVGPCFNSMDWIHTAPSSSMMDTGQQQHGFGTAEDKKGFISSSSVVGRATEAATKSPCSILLPTSMDWTLLSSMHGLDPICTAPSSIMMDSSSSSMDSVQQRTRRASSIVFRCWPCDGDGYKIAMVSELLQLLTKLTEDYGEVLFSALKHDCGGSN